MRFGGRLLNRFKEEKSQKFIFVKKETGWFFHAPNAIDMSVEDLEDCLEQLKELEGFEQ